MANETILQDPNYLNANEATQAAIRAKFGIAEQTLAPPDNAYLIGNIPKHETVKGVGGAVKNFAKGVASIADTGISGLNNAVGGLAYPLVRPFTTPERASQITSFDQNPIGNALGITNDPAYANEGSRRIAQTVGEYVEPAIEKAAQLTGIPKEDVSNMAQNLTLALPKAVSPITRPAGRAVSAGINAVDNAVDTLATRPTIGAPVRALDAAGNTVQRAFAPLQDSISAPIGRQRAQALRSQPNASVTVEAAPPDTAAMANGLRGGGAAQVEEALMRQQRAKTLPVEVDLTKGQSTKDTAQLQFEHDISRSKTGTEGAPLVDRYAIQNAKLLQNFDHYLDETGAKLAGEFGVSKVGSAVEEALGEKAATAKKAVNDAYEFAKKENENKVVSYQPILDYADSLTASLQDIRPIKVALEELRKNDLGDSTVKFNDLQETYKTLNRVISKNDNTELYYGRQVKDLIDEIGDANGGQAFKKAQALRRRYASDFQNNAAVAKLLENKKRYSGDRQIALEDVYSHVVERGSLQDLQNVARQLKATPKGQEAFKELQGQTIANMKMEITKAIRSNQMGDRVISAKQLDNIVRNLDTDGKLDYLFGKQSAQNIRDLRDVVLDVHEIPIGANMSGTTHAGIRALDSLLNSKVDSAFWGLGGVLNRIRQSGELKKQVKESLEYDPVEAARQLRKGK